MLRWVGRRAPAKDAGGLFRFAGVGTALRCALTAAVVSGLALAIAACGRDKGEPLGERVIPLGQPVPKGGGRYQVGQPYEIGGVRYRPHEDPSYDRTGSASWYGELFHGRRTANGEIYDMNRLSAAHPTLPLPVYAHVTNLRNGRSLVVRVNDRGPFKKNRIIDLSRRSAEILGFRKSGTAPVRVRYLRRAPLSGDDSYERRYLAAKGYRRYASSDESVAAGVDPIAVASLPPPPIPDRHPARPSVSAFAQAVPERSVTVAGLQGSPEPTGSIPAPSRLAPPQSGLLSGPAIQAGSFRNKDNAERARGVLSGIGPVDITEVDMNGETYYRVRVGPFADAINAAVALPLVTDAGYPGARILLQN